ncbi:MAG: hypothetical protein ABSH46_00055 [Bryobacteraceae bacterium]|jgi:hypothetical protein
MPRTTLRLCLVWIGAAAVAAAQSPDFRAPGQHPSLLLTPARLRLLQREHERRSPRWRQLESLVVGKASMPERAFADVLYFQSTGDSEAARRAVAWALGEGGDLRQLALVFDWCQTALTEQESAALAAKLEQALLRPPATAGVDEARSRTFAAIALAGTAPAVSERELRRIVDDWWRGKVVPSLAAGEDILPRSSRYALFEMMHAVRDNLNIDLRESARSYFGTLPALDLLSYYPEPHEAPENEYRVPASAGAEFDLHAAESARAADLAMAAYDTTSIGNQYLQGWLLHDLFAMHGPFGAPYEFLWANPYQPGLSYYHAPLAVHDSVVGQLFIRSGWDADARWAGLFGGTLLMFAGGKPQTIDLASPKLLDFDHAVVAVAGDASSLTFENAVGRIFLVGLKPRSRYQLGIGHSEREEIADPGGIIEMEFPRGFSGTIRTRLQR